MKVLIQQFRILQGTVSLKNILGMKPQCANLGFGVVLAFSRRYGNRLHRPCSLFRELFVGPCRENGCAPAGAHARVIALKRHHCACSKHRPDRSGHDTQGGATFRRSRRRAAWTETASLKCGGETAASAGGRADGLRVGETPWRPWAHFGRGPAHWSLVRSPLLSRVAPEAAAPSQEEPHTLARAGGIISSRPDGAGSCVSKAAE